MKQLVFEFVREQIHRMGLKLDPKVEEELVQRMAEAIVAVVEAERGESHEDHRGS